MKKLCIDCGHGMANASDAFDPGAVANGAREADIALAWGLTMKAEAASRGLEFFMPRTDNKTPARLSQRVARAVKEGCTHLLSIHCNSFSNAAATGVETFYGDEADRAFAEACHKKLVSATQLTDRGVKPASKTARGKLALERFPGPFCLCEIGFLSNPADLRTILARTVRMRFADGIVDLFMGEDGDDE